MISEYQVPAPHLPTVNAAAMTASAGYGEYFTDLGALPPPPMPKGPLRTVASFSPLAAGIERIATRRRSMQGLGQPVETGTNAAISGAALLAVVAVGLTVRGVAGYFAGKAMAPRGRESKYAWGGVVASILGGSLGLGIEGGIALSNR